MKRIFLYSMALPVFVLIVPPSPLLAREKANNGWLVPACAWSRPLGSHPAGATGKTKRRVPLGGVGRLTRARQDFRTGPGEFGVRWAESEVRSSESGGCGSILNFRCLALRIALQALKGTVARGRK